MHRAHRHSTWQSDGKPRWTRSVSRRPQHRRGTNIESCVTCRPYLPFTVVSIIEYALWFVCVKRNSSANLHSEVSRLHSFARAQRPRIAWPDFTADGGDSQTSRIEKIEWAYPAEVQGAPALTLRAGLSRAIAFLKRMSPNLRALQWIAILTMMHSIPFLLLRARHRVRLCLPPGR